MKYLLMSYLLLSWIPALRIQMYFDVDPILPPTVQGSIIKTVWMVSMIIAVIAFSELSFG